MKMNKWTLGLAALGLVSFASATQAQSTMLAPLSGTTISGYVDTSAQWDLGTGNANPAPYAFNQGKQDGFNLNVVDLKVAKPLDEAQWSAGYNLELMFGPDADEITGAEDFFGNGSNIRQAYVALRAPIPVGNGLDFKVGRFDSIIGYESTDSYKNPNFTRSYGYSITPKEHTGVLAEMKLADWISAAAGVANTAYTGAINARDPEAESSKTYMGGITLTAPESFGFLAGSSLYAGVLDGFSGFGTEDRTDVYAGATIATPLKGLRFGLAYDHVFNAAQTFGITDLSSYAAYASFQATEKLSLHVRGEYGEGDSFGSFLGTPGQFGTLSKVVAVTGTVQYDLWENVISRLEVRWDHAADGTDAFGGEATGTTIGTAPEKKNSVMIAANLIYKF